jgi:NAD/NADP transhydrogenase alpha subunit
MVMAHSVRNRFAGLVTRVARDVVIAQVEIPGRAAPVRVVAQP